MMTEELQEQSSYAASYGRDIRGIFRGLWAGTHDIDYAFGLMQDTVRIGLTRAFAEGTAVCGIVPAEWSPGEKLALANAIYTEQGYIFPVLEEIVAGSKANGGKWATWASRSVAWVQRYNSVREIAKSMACANQKATWVYGDTKDHCADCSRVVGRTYRIETWDRYGWVPGSNALACKGFRCDCRRMPTDAPVTPGRPPRLSGGGL